MKIDWSGRSHKYSKEDIKYIVNIIQNADPLTQGQYLKKFENDFAKYIKKKNVFAMSSAAAALEIIAILLKIKRWADINFASRTIDLDNFKKLVTKRTKAVVIVHLYGYAVDFRKIISFCRKRKIKIIEDCAQALGASINTKKVGTLGDFSCFSFHAQKNITTLGEGGMLFVKDNNLSKKVKGLRHNGHCDFKFKRKFYWKPAMGNLDMDLKNIWPYKFTLSEVQCGAGIVMLKKLDKLNSLRINRAEKMIKRLSNFKELEFFQPKSKKSHVYHLLSAYYKPAKKISRDDLIEMLFNKFSIKCAVQYYPLYKYPLFKKMGYGKKEKYKNTEKFFNNMISFPFHVWMKEKKFEYMINSVKKALQILRKKR